MTNNGRDEAVKRAAAILNYKNRSSEALRLKLLEKDVAPEDALYAVERLKELGYLNDGEYAASVVRACLRRGYGKERIKEKLRAEKLSDETAEEALAGVETDVSELAAVYASLCRDIRDPKEREKTAQKLVRRGFSWSEVSAAAREASENAGEEEGPELNEP
jgi:regulatory protein